MRHLRSRPAARTRLRNLGLGTAIAAAAFWLSSSRAADEAQQAEVAQRGAQGMPFALSSTIHIFTKTQDGGVQRLVVKDTTDLEQIKLIRKHLREMQKLFEQGDFSGPSHIHGDSMPGLAALKAAKPGAISYVYRDVDEGAQIAYRTNDTAVLAALHAWFDAQISNHGPDAVQGDELSRASTR